MRVLGTLTTIGTSLFMPSSKNPVTQSITAESTQLPEWLKAINDAIQVETATLIKVRDDIESATLKEEKYFYDKSKLFEKITQKEFDETISSLDNEIKRLTDSVKLNEEQYKKEIIKHLQQEAEFADRKKILIKELQAEAQLQFEKAKADAKTNGTNKLFSWDWYGYGYLSVPILQVNLFGQKTTTAEEEKRKSDTYVKFVDKFGFAAKPTFTENNNVELKPVAVEELLKKSDTYKMIFSDIKKASATEKQLEPLVKKAEILDADIERENQLNKFLLNGPKSSIQSAEKIVFADINKEESTSIKQKAGALIKRFEVAAQQLLDESHDTYKLLAKSKEDLAQDINSQVKKLKDAHDLFKMTLLESRLDRVNRYDALTEARETVSAFGLGVSAKQRHILGEYQKVGMKFGVTREQEAKQFDTQSNELSQQLQDDVLAADTTINNPTTTRWMRANRLLVLSEQLLQVLTIALLDAKNVQLWSKQIDDRWKSCSSVQIDGVAIDVPKGICDMHTKLKVNASIATSDPARLLTMLKDAANERGGFGKNFFNLRKEKTGQLYNLIGNIKLDKLSPDYIQKFKQDLSRLGVSIDSSAQLIDKSQIAPTPRRGMIAASNP